MTSPHADPILATELTVTLGGARIIRAADLRVSDGEMVALLGANGSGKSTLVKALLGIMPASSGSVHLFGGDVHGGRHPVPWRRIGYAPQRVAAATGTSATAMEMVASGLLDSRRLRPPRNWRPTVMAALDEVGLADRAKDSVQ